MQAGTWRGLFSSSSSSSSAASCSALAEKNKSGGESHWWNSKLEVCSVFLFFQIILIIPLKSWKKDRNKIWKKMKLRVIKAQTTKSNITTVQGNDFYLRLCISSEKDDGKVKKKLQLHQHLV